MSAETAEERIAMAVIGLNIIALAIFLYGYVGTDVVIGLYHGQPVLYYVPTRAAVVGALVLVAIGLAAVFSAGGRTFLARHKEAIAIIVVAASLGAGLIASQASRMPRVSLLGGKYDSYVLQVLAARALASGVNPYLVNYTAALTSSVPAAHLTYLYRSGPPYNVSSAAGIVSVLDYPAFSFLYYVPAVLLRIPGNMWDAIVLAVTLSLIYLRLKEPYRRFLLPVISAGMLYFLLDPITYDPLTGWLAPLLLVLVFASNPIISGVLLGLAISYREYAIAAALVYFPLAARRGVKRVGLGVLSMAATVLAINLPFLLWTGPAFIKEVLAPVKYGLDIEGLGLASLYFLTGRPLPRDPLLAAMAAIVLLTPFLTYYMYDRLGGLAYAISAVAFMFYPRPLYAYWAWFPWIGVIDFLLNDINRNEIPVRDGNAGFLASALSPLMAIAVMVASFSSASSGLINPYLVAIAGVGIFTSLLLILITASPWLYRVLVPVSLILGLVSGSLVIRQYDRAPEIVMDVLRLPIAVPHVNPVARLYPGATALGTTLVQLTIPYTSRLVLSSLISSVPFRIIIPSLTTMQFWTSILVAAAGALAYFSRRSLLELMLVSLALGAVVFIGTSPLTSFALLSIMVALALGHSTRSIWSAFAAAASVLSPIGLIGAIASVRRPSRLSVVSAAIGVVAVAAALKGGYIWPALLTASKYVYMYLIVGPAQLVTFIAEVIMVVLPPLVTATFSRLRRYAFASALISLSAIALAGLWEPSYAIGYVVYTLLQATIALNENLSQAFAGRGIWRRLRGPPS